MNPCQRALQPVQEVTATASDAGLGRAPVASFSMRSDSAAVSCIQNRTSFLRICFAIVPRIRALLVAHELFLGSFHLQKVHQLFLEPVGGLHEFGFELA